MAKHFGPYNHLLEWIFALLLISFLAVSLNLSDIHTPDGELYYGLAGNLIANEGYHDDIRDDIILPPIGHPILIVISRLVGLDSPELFSAILLFAGLFILFLGVTKLQFPRFYRLAIIPLAFFLIPKSFEWGIEMTLFFVNCLTFTAFIYYSKVRNNWTLIAFGLILSVNLLVRPILNPLLLTLIPLIILLTLTKNAKYLRNIIPIAIAIGLTMIVGFYSENQYGDKRLTNGTYSEIPLYCANNPYLDLKQNYYASLWKDELTPETYEKAIAPLKLTTTWQQRAELLRGHVIDFLIENPIKALQGYLWRLSKFTFSQNGHNDYIFYLWFILSIVYLHFYKKNLISSSWDILFLIITPLYIAGVTAVFPYVGARYNLSPNLFFLFSSLIISSQILQSNSRHIIKTLRNTKARLFD